MTFPENLPSRELTYPTWEKEHHLQNAIFGGDMLVPWRVLIIFGLPGCPRSFLHMVEMFGSGGT